MEARLVTHFVNKKDIINSGGRDMTAPEWIDAELARIRKYGGQAEIVEKGRKIAIMLSQNGPGFDKLWEKDLRKGTYKKRLCGIEMKKGMELAG